MSQYGITSAQLLAGTPIDATRVTHPRYRVSLEHYEAVVANMIRLTGNPGIAFSLGDIYINFGDLGLLGYAMLSSKDIWQALQIRVEYQNLVDRPPVDITSLKKTPRGGYEVTVSTPRNATLVRRFETEELLVQAIKRGGYLTDVTPVLEKAAFSYPAPPHRSLYECLCNCPLEFGAPRTFFTFLEPRLDTPVKTRNNELFEICSAHCRRVMRSGPDVTQLEFRIRSMFLAAPANLPDLREASSLLGLSVPTLRRRLEANNQSYQNLKDKFRFDLACEYVRTGHMSPKRISHLLGFSSPSNFSRAFKEWSGQTVRCFQQAAAKEALGIKRSIGSGKRKTGVRKRRTSR